MKGIKFPRHNQTGLITCLMLRSGRADNLLNMLMQGANYCDDVFITAANFQEFIERVIF